LDWCITNNNDLLLKVVTCFRTITTGRKEADKNALMNLNKCYRMFWKNMSAATVENGPQIWGFSQTCSPSVTDDTHTDVV